MRRALPFAALFLLAACGQKGPLYQPDAGTAVPVAPQSAPGSPTPAASPDRSDEGRKRTPTTPSPAQSK